MSLGADRAELVCRVEVRITLFLLLRFGGVGVKRFTYFTYFRIKKEGKDVVDGKDRRIKG